MSDREPVIRPEADWPVRPLGELVTVLRRGTAPVYVDDSGVKAIGQRCVTDADFNGSLSRPHSAKAMSNVVVPQAGDVLVNSTGTGTIGRSAIFREDGTRYIVDGHVTVVRPRDDDLIGRWLNDVLRSPQGQRYLEARCYAGSTNQIELSSSALAAMPVAVPTVDEQRRIAKILDTLDRQIRLVISVSAKLQLARSGVLQDLVGSRMPNAMLADALLNAPANGIYKPADLIGRGTLLVGQTAFTSDRKVDPMAARRAVVTRSEVRRFGLTPNDILVSRVFATLEGVGQPALVGDLMEDAVFESNMMRIRCDTARAEPYFVFQTLLTARVRAHIVRRANLSNQASISQSALTELPIWLPSLSEQRRVDDALRSLDHMLSAQQSLLAKLTAEKEGLLADLLSGRVRVPAEVAS